jgi:uncharacterized protein (PEP-CTERM system associated)
MPPDAARHRWQHWGGLGLLSATFAATAATSSITPTLDLQSTVTSNVLASEGAQGKKELINSASPGLIVDLRAGGFTAAGNGRVTWVHYTRHSQPDKVMPNGQGAAKWLLPDANAGIESTASANQVKSTFLARGSTTPTTLDTYTNASVGVAPFVRHQFTPNLTFDGKLSRRQTITVGEGSGLDVRPKSRVTDDRLSLAQTPQPAGWRLEWTHQATYTQQMIGPSLDEEALRLVAQHAPWPELTVGLSLGQARSQVENFVTQDQPRGLQMDWRPSERTRLQGQVERRYYGNGWKIAASHRSPWFALQFAADRAPTTYAAAIGTVPPGSSLKDLYSAMLTTRIPDPVERAQVVDELMTRRQLSGGATGSGDLYDQRARLLQRTTGSLAFMGRRDVVTVAAGLTRSSPLSADADPLLSLSGQATKEYHFDAQANHLLSPTMSMSGGVRWTRAWLIRQADGVGVLSRDFSWRLGLNSNLSASTTATLSLRRQIAHAPAPNNTNETAASLALMHRF